MPRSPLAAALAFCLLGGSAAAQTAPPLTYAAPLSPAAVKEVQQRLREAGAYAGAVDGVWGGDSATALQRFQQTRGLQVTGQLNEATVRTLGVNPADLVAPPAQAAGGVGQPLSREVVRNIQGRLRQLGFYRGGGDGIWGPGTQAALERFQQSRNLQVTGQPDPSTATAMGLDPNNLSAGGYGSSMPR